MCQVNSQVKMRCTETTILIDKSDRIAKIEGCYDEAIEFLKITTKDNKEVKVGINNNGKNYKKFAHEFKECEIPITLFAGFDLCKDSNNPNELQLMFLGIEFLDESKLPPSKDKDNSSPNAQNNNNSNVSNNNSPAKTGKDPNNNNSNGNNDINNNTSTVK